MNDLCDFCLKWQGFNCQDDFNLAKLSELMLWKNTDKYQNLKKIEKKERHLGGAEQ